MEENVFSKPKLVHYMLSHISNDDLASKLTILSIFQRYFLLQGEHFEQILDQFLTHNCVEMQFNDYAQSVYLQSERQKILTGYLTSNKMAKLMSALFEKITDWQCFAQIFVQILGHHQMDLLFFLAEGLSEQQYDQLLSQFANHELKNEVNSLKVQLLLGQHLAITAADRFIEFVTEKCILNSALSRLDTLVQTVKRKLNGLDAEQLLQLGRQMVTVWGGNLVKEYGERLGMPLDFMDLRHQPTDLLKNFICKVVDDLAEQKRDDHRDEVMHQILLRRLMLEMNKLEVHQENNAPKKDSARNKISLI